VFELTSYLGLFVAAFGAATLLPLQSEALLVGMLISHNYSTLLLVVVASVGNVLGSLVNWYIGRSIEHFRDRRWFPLKQHQLEKAQVTYRRFGRWSLLASWVPVIGDPITMIAGIMREPLWSFLIIVTLAKMARYLVLTALTLGWTG